MKEHLFMILSFIILFISTHSILSPNPINNITLKNTTGATRIVLQSLGNKFATWNNKSELLMYSINGTLLCSNKLTQQIQRLIWPSQYVPIILNFPGSTFSTLNESTCRIIKTFNFSKVVNLNTEPLATELNFLWKNGAPFVILTGRNNIYEVEMSSESFSNSYGTRDGNPNIRYQTAVYSLDGKYVIGGSYDMTDGTRTVRVWNATKIMETPLKQFTLKGPVIRFAASSDNSTFIGVGYSATNDSIYGYRFDRDGNVKSTSNFSVYFIVSRNQSYKALPLGEGNTVAFFKNFPSSFELVRTGDNSTIDNKTFSTVNAFVEADYVNKVLIVLDSAGKVLTYDYYPDDDVSPIPDPVDTEEGFPIWAIAVVIVVGIIVLTVVLMYVFRQKLPKGFRQKLPKCFKGTKSEQKESLIDKYDREEEVARKKSDERKQIVRDPVPEPKPKSSIVVQPMPVQPIIQDEPNEQPQEQEPQAQESDRPQQSSEQSQKSSSSQQQLEQPSQQVIPKPMSDAEMIEALKKQQQLQRQQESERYRILQLERLKREQLQRRRKERQQEQERQKSEKDMNKYQHEQEPEEKGGFADERRNLIVKKREQQKDGRIQEGEEQTKYNPDYQMPIIKNFFQVKRKDSDHGSDDDLEKFKD